jgi:hypothetical protein
MNHLFEGIFETLRYLKFVLCLCGKIVSRKKKSRKTWTSTFRLRSEYGCSQSVGTFSYVPAYRTPDLKTGPPRAHFIKANDYFVQVLTQMLTMEFFTDSSQ